MSGGWGRREGRPLSEGASVAYALDRWKLPHLRLEAEATPGSIEQLNVRVQSFVESLL
jgi:benzoyl-CoA reductase/2-hydroxyglutaryl-CoA dehydratase subunit BcrC/BadD/HgdB